MLGYGGHTNTNTNTLISFQGNRPICNCIEPIICKAIQWMDHQLTSSDPLPPLSTARYSSDKGTATLIHDFTSWMTAWLFSLQQTGSDTQINKRHRSPILLAWSNSEAGHKRYFKKNLLLHVCEEVFILALSVARHKLPLWNDARNSRRQDAFQNVFTRIPVHTLIDVPPLHTNKGFIVQKK
jgi:hypothetical protein